MDLKIEYTASPENKDIDQLTDGINQDAGQKGIKEIAETFAFFARNDSGSIIAGCNGSIIYGTIYTDQLWVAATHRKQGLGKMLMEKVHALGREKGCTMATTCTMSFQDATPFYERFGYISDFTRDGYAKNSTCRFLKILL